MPPVRIGIVGLNFGAQVVKLLSQNPARRQLRLVAVCDLDGARAAALAREANVRAMAYEEMIDDPAVEAIGLFTGPSGRARLIQDALRRGKHVLTTKPFELDPVAAKEALAEAARLGLVIHLNSPGPAPTSDLRQIEQWRSEHRLGRLVGARGEAWGDYHEQADGTWYDDDRLCPAAPIFRLGIYLVNDLLQIAGAPSAIQVAHSRFRTGRPTPDNALLTLFWPEGCLASVYASLCVRDSQPYRNALTLNFERGTIYRNVATPLAPYGRTRCRLVLVRPGRSAQPLISRRSLPVMSGDYQWREFAEAVRLRQPLSGRAAASVILSIAIVNRLHAAAASGRKTPLVPEPKQRLPPAPPP